MNLEDALEQIEDDDTFFDQLEQYRQAQQDTFNSLVGEIKSVTTLLKKQQRQLVKVQAVLADTEIKKQALDTDIKQLEKRKEAQAQQVEQADQDLANHLRDVKNRKEQLATDLAKAEALYQSNLASQEYDLKTKEEAKKKELEYMQKLIADEQSHYLQAIELSKQQQEQEYQKIADMSKGSFIAKVQGILNKKGIKLDLMKEL
jgi:chromosome segregation ATPase